MTKLDHLVILYRTNLWFFERNPLDFEAMLENEYIYHAMIRLIPQSHYDEINEIVYGIKRKL